MLLRVKELIGFAVHGLDQEIGHVEDLYLEDTDWSLQYMVVDTGPLFFGRHIVVAPDALGKPAWAAGRLPVELSKEQVASAPELDLDAPISNRVLGQLHAHFGWPARWTEDELLGTTYIGAHPVVESGSGSKGLRTTPQNEPLPPVDRHLRSAKEILGYEILATDERVGPVEDLLVDDADWVVRHVLVDAGPSGSGRPRLIPTEVVKRVGWTDRTVQVMLTREQVAERPEYDLPLPGD